MFIVVLWGFEIAIFKSLVFGFENASIIILEIVCLLVSVPDSTGRLVSVGFLAAPAERKKAVLVCARADGFYSS